MDFTFTEEQETISKVARQLFELRATPDHLTQLEAADARYDAALWAQLYRITDEIALTEGNARVLGNATSGGVFMGRPLEGTSYQASVAYRW